MSKSYIITDGSLQATVDEFGAQLISLRKDDTEYLWGGDPRYWKEHAPVLFPFVGRFTEGKYKLKGREYPMEIHGFAKRLSWEMTEQTTDAVTLCLRSGEKTLSSYPYQFCFYITYRLHDSQLDVTYQVENHSEERMYFGIGGHPGFRVPLDEGLAFEDYYLEFSREAAPDRIGFTPACFLSGHNQRFPLEQGRILRLRHDLFDDDAIVLQHMADEVTLKSDKGHRSVTVSYPDCPYVGFWHAPKKDAPYLCIEPWASLPSRQDVVEDFSCRSDLIRLQPGGIYENRWNIRL